jgi:hypothetical protein
MMAGCSCSKSNARQRLFDRVTQSRIKTAQPDRLIVIAISPTVHRNGTLTSLNKLEPFWLIKVARCYV